MVSMLSVGQFVFDSRDEVSGASTPTRWNDASAIRPVMRPATRRRAFLESWLVIMECILIPARLCQCEPMLDCAFILLPLVRATM